MAVLVVFSYIQVLHVSIALLKCLLLTIILVHIVMVSCYVMLENFILIIYSLVTLLNKTIQKQLFQLK